MDRPSINEIIIDTSLMGSSNITLLLSWSIEAETYRLMYRDDYSTQLVVVHSPLQAYLIRVHVHKYTYILIIASLSLHMCKLNPEPLIPHAKVSSVSGALHNQWGAAASSIGGLWSHLLQ